MNERKLLLQIVQSVNIMMKTLQMIAWDFAIEPSQGQIQKLSGGGGGGGGG